MLIQCLFSMMLSQGAFADTPASHQMEFDETVVEGVGATLSGVTAVHTKQDTGPLFRIQMDFKDKVQDSVAEMPYTKFSVITGGKK